MNIDGKSSKTINGAIFGTRPHWAKPIYASGLTKGQVEHQNNNIFQWGHVLECLYMISDFLVLFGRVA